MKKSYLISSFTIIFLLFSISGCGKNDVSTISVHSDSEYMTTFEDLNLGTVCDFDLKNYNADSNWVNIWVEHYKDGEMDPQPVTKLTYGMSPNKVDEGRVGMAIVETDDNSPLIFLYSPSAKTSMTKVGEIPSVNVFRGWDSAIGEEEQELELGETYLLGAYRVSAGDFIRTYDLQDEEEVKKMIDDDSHVFLLKIKLEENR